MRSFTALVEALEARPDDADRVAALARHLRAVGRDAGAIAARWLVAGARPRRPVRLTQPVLAAAAARLAAGAGTAPWLFDAGLAASDETAEAIALLLPWPSAPTGSTRPSLADWLAAWQSAAASPPDERPDAIAATIAALDDALARRWAVRAACGLVRPVVERWQWQRAWALAFGEDAHALAWAWHHDATMAAAPDPSFALRPRPFATSPDADAAAYADLLAAWRAGVLWAEPRWRGERVQLVRRGAALALWHADGRLADEVLREAWLVAADWPDPCVVEAVLVERGASRHLVLVDWQLWADDEAAATPPAERRARLLARWPVRGIDDDGRIADTVRGIGDDVDVDRASELDGPPVFTTAAIDAAPHAGEAMLATIATTAARARHRLWSGLVLRSRTQDPTPVRTVRATAQRVRAVLQYVSTEAFAAPAALAFGACGFALWSRTPLGEREQQDAMAAALDGEFLPPPTEAPDLPALRLLPLARAPLELPGDALAAIHAWLRAHAGRRFGGVHAVLPALVFELGFARARPSTRHRLGWVLERPRVLRWLSDAPAGAADRVEDLAALVDDGRDATITG